MDEMQLHPSGAGPRCRVRFIRIAQSPLVNTAAVFCMTSISDMDGFITMADQLIPNWYRRSAALLTWKA
jgi:hypothetical protein